MLNLIPILGAVALPDARIETGAVPVSHKAEAVFADLVEIREEMETSEEVPETEQIEKVVPTETDAREEEPLEADIPEVDKSGKDMSVADPQETEIPQANIRESNKLRADTKGRRIFVTAEHIQSTLPKEQIAFVPSEENRPASCLENEHNSTRTDKEEFPENQRPNQREKPRNKSGYVPSPNTGRPLLAMRSYVQTNFDFGTQPTLIEAQSNSVARTIDIGPQFFENPAEPESRNPPLTPRASVDSGEPVKSPAAKADLEKTAPKGNQSIEALFLKVYDDPKAKKMTSENTVAPSWSRSENTQRFSKTNDRAELSQYDRVEKSRSKWDVRLPQAAPTKPPVTYQILPTGSVPETEADPAAIANADLAVSKMEVAIDVDAVRLSQLPSVGRSVALVPSDVPATQHNLPRHIAKQLFDAVLTTPGRSVEISLDPAELGKVRMAISTRDEVISVSILADRPETLELMRRHSAQYEHDFQALGFGNISFSFEQGANPQGAFSENESRNEDAAPVSYSHEPHRISYSIRPDAGIDIRL